MKTSLLLLFLSISVIGKCQVLKQINVGTAGTLSTLLTEDEKSTVTDLTVTGIINALDIKCMRDQIANLKNLNLSNADIAAFTGIATSNVSYSYPANEMPRFSFYNGTSGKAKKTLVSVILPNSLTSIGQSAFYLNENIKTIYIGNLITNIGAESFKGCYGLTTVTMGNSVTTIQAEAFNYCYLLKDITLSENITYIGEQAFRQSLIEKVVFPNSMTTITDGFRECNSLKEVTLPASITNILNWAFQRCNGLNTIISLNTTPPICDAYSFHLVPNVTSVYVPASSVSAYKSAPVWGDNFYSVIKAIPSITSFSIPNQIGSAAISEVDRTISVTLPYGTALNNLIATLSLPTGATAKVGTTVQTSGTTANNFTSPVVYAITSGDGLLTRNWTVNVRIAVVVPVSLISYNVKLENNKAVIRWETGSEANNNRFDVLRSTDNKNYITAATVKGNGTTSEKFNYVAYDVNPNSGVNYYKLIQIDNDGTTKELGIQSLNYTLNQTTNLIVYPNPVSEILNIQVANTKAATAATLTLININGQVSLTKSLQLSEGINNLSLDISRNIVPGQYILNVVGENIKESSKVTIK